MNDFDTVKQFFAEHPVHSFSVVSIAEYLGLPEATVVGAVNNLWLEGFIDRFYNLYKLRVK